jgi:hypothetical protein
MNKKYHKLRIQHLDFWGAALVSTLHIRVKLRFFPLSCLSRDFGGHIPLILRWIRHWFEH